MLTLLTSLIGFLAGMVPDVMKIYRDKQDREHEKWMMLQQIEAQKQQRSERIEEIRLNSEAAEYSELYKTWNTGVQWVDALNGTVRPVLCYSFFLLYAGVKLMHYSMLPDAPLPWQLTVLWGEEDQAIFAGIISFYFGQRAFTKARK